MCLFDLYFKIFLTLVLDYKIETKKAFNQSIINGERHEETKKVEKSEYAAEKREDVKI